MPDCSDEPPYGCGDRAVGEQTRDVEHLGCRESLAAIARIKPRLVICGHIHGGYGHFECDGTPVYNVSVVNQQDLLVRSPTVIDIAHW